MPDWNDERLETTLVELLQILAAMAYEMRLMAERYVSDGMLPEPGDVESLEKILSRPLRSYR